MSESNQDETTAKSFPRTRSGRFWFGIVTVGIWLLGLGVSAQVYLQDDVGFFRIAVFVSVLLGSIFSLIWFRWFGQADQAVRKLVGRGAIGLVVLCIALVRLEAVSGGMWPKLRFV
ncbi:MAG: hypothetical protein KDB27_32255, partial [Planctomycetales bacterium]|nr:hypothetical protein [Planctomycetales bacterium]